MPLDHCLKISIMKIRVSLMRWKSVFPKSKNLSRLLFPELWREEGFYLGAGTSGRLGILDAL